MQVVKIERRTNTGSLGAGICRLLEAVGTPVFDRTLADLAYEALSCSYVAMFAFAAGASPKLARLAARGNRPAIVGAVSRYAERHWVADPGNIFTAQVLEPDRAYLVFVAGSDISDELCRRECFDAPGIGCQASVLKRHRGEYLKVAFGRARHAGRFEPEVMQELLLHADMLFGLLLKHSESVQACAGADELAQLYLKNLARRCPELTPRERDVCALIGAGLTSERIAHQLGIAVNSVRTYRRRAYERLAICSQNELLRLVS